MSNTTKVKKMITKIEDALLLLDNLDSTGDLELDELARTVYTGLVEALADAEALQEAAS